MLVVLLSGGACTPGMILRCAVQQQWDEYVRGPWDARITVLGYRTLKRRSQHLVLCTTSLWMDNNAAASPQCARQSSIGPRFQT